MSLFDVFMETLKRPPTSDDYAVYGAGSLEDVRTILAASAEGLAAQKAGGSVLGISYEEQLSIIGGAPTESVPSPSGLTAEKLALPLLLMGVLWLWGGRIR